MRKIHSRTNLMIYLNEKISILKKDEVKNSKISANIF